jgi:carbonic anhydrase
VASAESMLTARAVDVLADSREGIKGGNQADLNREMIAQGAANTAAGLLGGIPMTAVMVRSAANVNAGGKTRWSAILHGAWIAIFVGMLPFILTRIPLAALAAVLVLTGIKLLNLPTWLREVRSHPVQGALWAFTTLAIVSTDLLKGLIIALVGAALLSLPKLPALVASYQTARRKS